MTHSHEHDSHEHCHEHENKRKLLPFLEDQRAEPKRQGVADEADGARQAVAVMEMAPGFEGHG